MVRSISRAVLGMGLAMASSHGLCGEGLSPSKPLVVISGDDSRLTEKSFRRIRSDVEWNQVWLEHLGLKQDTLYRPKMEVDFTRCEVVAIFGGKTVNCTGYLVDSVAENGEQVEIRLLSSSYQTAGPDGGADNVTPFAFIVLPRVTKAVTVMENASSYIGEPPKWVRAADLARDDSDGTGTD